MKNKLLDKDSDGKLNAATNESETVIEETETEESKSESESKNTPVAEWDSNLPWTLVVDGPINPSNIAAMADRCLQPTKE